MKKRILALALALVLLFPLVGCFGESRPVLRVFNVGSYIDRTTIREFEREFGVKVVYDEFNTNEEMYVVISRNPSAYDIVVPSDYMIDRLIQEDRLASLDHSLIPNISEIAPQYLAPSYDPDNEFSVPYMVGTLGIIYNTTMVDEPITSWSSLWDEKYSGEIFVWDSVRDAVGMALAYLGYDINTNNEEELLEAQEALIAQRPLVQAYLGDEIMDKMIAGEGTLALEYSGGARAAMNENPDLDYVVPSEGSNKWLDGWVILKDTQQYEVAHQFINFMNRPDIALRNMEYTCYTSPVEAAWESFGDDAVMFPSEEVLERCAPFLYSEEGARRKSEIWTTVRATR